MPSYRAVLVLGTMHAGVDPAQVFPAAMAHVRAHERAGHVEAGTVEIVRGLPRVTVRFEAADDLDAAAVGRSVSREVDALVVVESSRVVRRWGNRWLPLR